MQLLPYVIIFLGEVELVPIVLLNNVPVKHQDLIYMFHGLQKKYYYVYLPPSLLVKPASPGIRDAIAYDSYLTPTPG